MYITLPKIVRMSVGEYEQRAVYKRFLARLFIKKGELFQLKFGVSVGVSICL